MDQTNWRTIMEIYLFENKDIHILGLGQPILNGQYALVCPLDLGNLGFFQFPNH